MNLFAVTHSNPALFAVTHSNPALFAVTQIVLQVNLRVDAVSTGSVTYAPGSAVSCTISLTNLGAVGSQIIQWEVIDSSDVVKSSGTQSSGTIGKRTTGNAEITGITAPDEYSIFRIRTRISGDPDWVYSAIKYSLPVDLSANSITRDDEYYAKGAEITCSVNVTNAGYSGSETIEWQVIKQDLTVLSSGTQSSGTIGDFATANVSLTGITSPAGIDVVFHVRARISGETSWKTSNFMVNFIITPPPNPTPRE